MPNFLQQITVEPIALITLFSYLLYAPAEPSNLYANLENYVFDEIKDKDTLEWEVGVKKAMVYWGIIANIINIPLVMFVTMIMGAWADKKGRQLNMMTGLASLIVYLVGRMLLFSQWGGSGILPDAFFFPIYGSLVFEVLDAVFGDYLVTYTAALAFLADIVPEKDTLTVRLNWIIVCRYVGGCAGALTAWRLASHVHITWWVLAVMSLLTINFFYAFARIPHIPPIKIWHEFLLQGRAEAKSHERYVSRKYTAISEHEAGLDDDDTPGICGMFVDILKMVWQGVLVVFKKRTGSKRMLIILLTLSWLLEAVVFYEKSNIIVIYTLGHPFLWNSDQLSIFLALRLGLTGIGSGLGVFVVKRVFKMQDTLIIIISIFFATASMVPIVLATQDWHIYVSTAIGMFGSMDQSARLSFLTRLVEPDEVGKIFTFNSVVLAIAFLFMQIVLQNLYAWSLDFFPKLVWLIIIAMGIGIFFVVIFVHIRANAEGLNKNPDDDEGMPAKDYDNGAMEMDADVDKKKH